MGALSFCPGNAAETGTFLGCGMVLSRKCGETRDVPSAQGEIIPWNQYPNALKKNSLRSSSGIWWASMREVIPSEKRLSVRRHT